MQGTSFNSIKYDLNRGVRITPEEKKSFNSIKYDLNNVDVKVPAHDYVVSILSSTI